MPIFNEYEMLFRLRGEMGGDFQKSFSGAGKKISELQTKIRDLNRNVGMIQSYKNAQKQLSDYQNRLEKLKNTTGGTAKEQEKQEKEIKKLQTAMEKASANVKKYEEQMKKAGVATDKADEELADYQKQIDKLKDRQRLINSVTESFEKQKKAIAETKKELKVVAGAYTAFLGTSYKLAIQPAAELQQSMANVKAYYGASDEEVEQLKALSRETGLNTKYTSVESAGAFESMAKAGWSVADSIAGLPGMISLAAATDESLPSVTETVVENLNAFKLDPDQASYFADLISAAAMGSTADVSDLQEALKYVGSIASSMKFSAADTMLMLGVLANGGIKGSQAGTSMRRIMTGLAGGSLTYNSRDGKEGFSVETVNEDGTIRPLREIVKDLRTAMNGMDSDSITAMMEETSLPRLAEQYGVSDWEEMDEEELYNAVMDRADGLSDAGQALAAQDIAMKTAMSSLLTLVGASEEDFETLANAIDHCTGAAEEMARIKLDTLQGDVELLKSAVQETGITVGDEFLPDLREMAQGATEVVGKINDWVVSHKDLVHEIGTFAAKAGPFLMTLLSVKLGMQGIAAVGTKAFQKILTGDFSGVATALVALGGAAVYAYNRMEEAKIGEKFGDITLSAEEVREAVSLIIDTRTFERAAQAMKSFDGLNDISAQIREYRDELTKDIWKIETGFSYSESDLQGMADRVGTMFDEIRELVAERGYAAQNGVKAILGDDANYKGMTEYLLSTVNESGETLAEEFARAFEDGVEIDAEKIADTVKTALNEADRLVALAERKTKANELAQEYLSYGSYQDLTAAMQEYADTGVKNAQKTYAETKGTVEADLELAREKLQNATTAKERKNAETRIREAERTLSELEESGYEASLGSAYVEAGQFQFDTLDQATGGAMSELKAVFDKMQEQAAAGADYDYLYTEYSNQYNDLSKEDRKLLESFSKSIYENWDEIESYMTYAAQKGDAAGAAKAQDLLGMATLQFYAQNMKNPFGSVWRDLFSGDKQSYQGIADLSDMFQSGEIYEGDVIVDGVNINITNQVSGPMTTEEMERFSNDLANSVNDKLAKGMEDAARRSFRSPVKLAIG